MSSYNYSSLFLLLSPSPSLSSLPPFLTLLTFFLPLAPFRVSILSPFFFSFPRQGKSPKVPNMSHHSHRPSILIPLFFFLIVLSSSLSHGALVSEDHLTYSLLSLPLPVSSPYLSTPAPQSCLQQLEVQVLRLGLASTLPSGLSGGGDRGDSRAKEGAWDRAGAGDGTWTGETEAGAVVKEEAGDSGTTAPPPPPPPPLPSLESLSRSKWTRAACWALRVAERWAGRVLKPAVSCSTRVSRESIWRSKSSLRSLSSDMSSYMTLCICERRGERRGDERTREESGR